MLIDKLYDSQKTVIDIGCGNGQLTKRIAGKFKAIHSIDINKTRIQKLQLDCVENKIPNVYAYEMSAYDLRFDTNTFDLAIFYRSVDHIENYETAIKEAYRVLKPGKEVYINVADGSTSNSKISAMNEIREFEDELIDYLGNREGMCEVKLVNSNDLITSLADIGFETIEASKVKIDTSKVEEYYKGVCGKIDEMMSLIRQQSEEQYNVFSYKLNTIHERIAKSGYDLLPLVEILAVKGNR